MNVFQTVNISEGVKLFQLAEGLTVSLSFCQTADSVNDFQPMNQGTKKEAAH